MRCDGSETSSEATVFYLHIPARRVAYGHTQEDQNRFLTQETPSNAAERNDGKAVTALSRTNQATTFPD
jgi:hypothetical protein